MCLSLLGVAIQVASSSWRKVKLPFILKYRAWEVRVCRDGWGLIYESAYT